MVYLLKISLLHKLFLYFHKDINIQAFCISCTYIFFGGGLIFGMCGGARVCVRVCVCVCVCCLYKTLLLFKYLDGLIDKGERLIFGV